MFCHIRHKAMLYAYNLATLCLSATLPCVDFMHFTMGDVFRGVGCHVLPPPPRLLVERKHGGSRGEGELGDARWVPSVILSIDSMVYPENWEIVHTLVSPCVYH